MGFTSAMLQESQRDASDAADALRSAANLGAVHQRAKTLQVQCQDFLRKAELALQSVSPRLSAAAFTPFASVTLLLPRATQWHTRHTR